VHEQSGTEPITFECKIWAYVQISHEFITLQELHIFVLCIVSADDIVMNLATSQTYKQLIVVAVLFLLVMTTQCYSLKYIIFMFNTVAFTANVTLFVWHIFRNGLADFYKRN
jgi:hypothetical protein